MKTRIITAAIAIPLLLIILLVAPEIVAALVFGALMAVGAYEFLYRTGLVRRIRLVVYSAVMAFAMSIWSYYGGLQAYLMIGSVIFFMLLFSEIMMDHVKVSIESVGLCTLGGYLIPLLLSFGLEEFSVSPNAILETRRQIARWSKADADAIAAEVMAQETTQDVQAALARLTEA